MPLLILYEWRCFLMKKISILFLLFIIVLDFQGVSANEYTAYQEVTFEHNGMMLLEDYTESDYKKYYGKISKRRFWGWRHYKARDNEKAYFIKETMYVIINEGDSAITETFSFAKSKTIKTQFGTSGSVELSSSGGDKGFKLGLDEAIKWDTSATLTSDFEQEFDIKVLVDPMTKLTVQICGEGKVTNGVAVYYRFFRPVRKGGWEIFVVTTEYYSIVKEKN